MTQEHDKLKPCELSERDRMLAFINFRQEVAANGRSMAELDAAEQAQLETLIAEAYDRPATWMQNILCFHYDRCRTPMTGGDVEAPKSRGAQYAVNAHSPIAPFLKVYPNPASNWSAVDYDVMEGADRAQLVVRDVLGREVFLRSLGINKGQVVLDTRIFAKGLYTVELQNAGLILQSEKLLVE